MCLKHTVQGLWRQWVGGGTKRSSGNCLQERGNYLAVSWNFGMVYEMTNFYEFLFKIAAKARVSGNDLGTREIVLVRS